MNSYNVTVFINVLISGNYSYLWNYSYGKGYYVNGTPYGYAYGTPYGYAYGYAYGTTYGWKLIFSYYN